MHNSALIDPIYGVLKGHHSCLVRLHSFSLPSLPPLLARDHMATWLMSDLHQVFLVFPIFPPKKHISRIPTCLFSLYVYFLLYNVFIGAQTLHCPSYPMSPTHDFERPGTTLSPLLPSRRFQPFSLFASGCCFQAAC